MDGHVIIMSTDQRLLRKTQEMILLTYDAPLLHYAETVLQGPATEAPLQQQGFPFVLSALFYIWYANLRTSRKEFAGTGAWPGGQRDDDEPLEFLLGPLYTTEGMFTIPNSSSQEYFEAMYMHYEDDPMYERYVAPTKQILQQQPQLQTRGGMGRGGGGGNESGESEHWQRQLLQQVRRNYEAAVMMVDDGSPGLLLPREWLHDVSLFDDRSSSLLVALYKQARRSSIGAASSRGGGGTYIMFPVGLEIIAEENKHLVVMSYDVHQHTVRVFDTGNYLTNTDDLLSALVMLRVVAYFVHIVLPTAGLPEVRSVDLEPCFAAGFNRSVQPSACTPLINSSSSRPRSGRGGSSPRLPLLSGGTEEGKRRQEEVRAIATRLSRVTGGTCALASTLYAALWNAMVPPQAATEATHLSAVGRRDDVIRTVIGLVGDGARLASLSALLIETTLSKCTNANASSTTSTTSGGNADDCPYLSDWWSLYLLRATPP